VRQGGRRDLWAVTITAGNVVTRDGLEIGVPKRDLITSLEVLVESGRLEIVRQLRHSETLLHELGLLERRMSDGTQRNLAAGALVKIGQAPAIYWVYRGQFHAFQTWVQFLSVGGRPDLSNVTYFSSMTDGGGLYGAPVPLN
jgi:hypothetical protein